MDQSVALLMEDKAQAKEVSDMFKSMGVMPEYYDSLRDFWPGILTSQPSLCIVDVKLMSDGELVYKNHPLVQSKKTSEFFLLQRCLKAFDPFYL